MKLIAGPGALSALAALAIALALQLSDGAFEPTALALVTLGTLLALAAALWLRFAAPVEDPLVARSLFGLGCAAGLACQFFVNPTAYGDPLAFRGGFQWFAALALVLLSAYLCIHLRASLIKARFLLLLVCFAVMAIVVLKASPRPWIDVWFDQTGAAQALRDGVNPYNVSFPDIYGPEALKMYGPQLLHGHRVIAYPYPPLTVLLNLPALRIFGDVRAVSLVAMLLGAWALARAIPGATGELAALFVLFQPRTFFVLEQAWTEPLVFATFALALLFARKPAKRIPDWLALGLALGALAASKQYAPLLIVPLWLSIPPELRKRATLTGAALLAATLLPFFLWNPAGFWRGVVQMQFLQPLRADALSLLALYARSFGPPWWGALPAFVAAALVLALTVRRRLSAAQALSSAGAAWLLFVLLNKQAFCNYDWLGAALVCGAAAASTETA